MSHVGDFSADFFLFFYLFLTYLVPRVSADSIYIRHAFYPERVQLAGKCGTTKPLEHLEK